MRGGYFIIQMTTLDGKTLGTYGPYSLVFVRGFFDGMTRDKQLYEHAISLAVEAPGGLVDVCDIQKSKTGEEYIAWSLRLSYHQAN